MSVSNKAKNKNPISVKPEVMPPFDDLVDAVKFAETNDLGNYLGSLEEISPEQVNAERKRRQSEWAAMDRETRMLIRVGEAVRGRLLLMGMRQADLARQMGINRSWVTRLVQGQENLTVSKLSELAVILKCEESDLLQESAPVRIAPKRPTGNKITPVVVRSQRLNKKRATATKVVVG